MTRLADNLARLSLAAELVCADAAAWAPDQQFDAVLLDAPCSATGTIRRHPDIPWLKSEADIVKLAGLQRRLIERAAALTKPGGTLVYCTCSLRAGGERNHRRRFSRARPKPAARADRRGGGFRPCDREFITTDGDLRTLPCQLPDADSRLAGLDGFYAARLVKG